MWDNLPFFPEQASTVAAEVDALYLFLVGVSTFFSLLIFSLVFFFAIKYRRRSEDELPRPIVGSVALETLWTVIPFLLAMIMFIWGTSLYFKNYRPPKHALDIYVTGKQWMWKFQHMAGQREINQLHVPVGRPVKLTMASEDVIHSLYIPAFRVKRDVVPGRYSTLWFEATKTGTYHLFCAEYCGTQHSGMGGQVVVMEPAHYEEWLGGAALAAPQATAAMGEKLFLQYGCSTCHLPDDQSRAPSLQGLFGRDVHLQDADDLVADEGYIRESILNPQARVVEGFFPIMPPYQGHISEEEVLQIIAYIRSLRTSTRSNE